MTTRSRSSATSLALRLRETRRLAGLSAAHVARHLDVRRPAIHEMESGKRKVGGEELIRMAELYGVSASWLMDGRSTRLTDVRTELAAQLLESLTAHQLEQLMDLIVLVRNRPGL
jgi:transcriptional regulator with XRE-family HTH domain